MGGQYIGYRAEKVALQFFRGAYSTMWFVIEACKHFDWQSIAHFRKPGIRDMTACVSFDFRFSESLAKIRVVTFMIAGISIESIFGMPLPMRTSATFVLAHFNCKIYYRNNPAIFDP